MSDISIKEVMDLGGKRCTVVIEEGIISEVLDDNVRPPETDRVIEGKDLIIMPGLCNSHTHAPMSLLRGLGEGKELDRWLKESIWPLEAKMKKEDFRAGLELACLEMIRTGTTLFNDMYFAQGEMASVVEGIGLRAVLGEGFIDLFDEEKRERGIRDVVKGLDKIENLKSPLVKGSLSPHAVYTVSDEGLIWCGEEARKRDMTLHIHVSETMEEVKECRKRTGLTPPAHLDKLGILNSRVIAAHCVHLTYPDIKILGERRVHPCHLPSSNMKLSVGGQMDLPKMLNRGIGVLLGTDGAASNNNLDMFEEIKTAALLSKHSFGAASVEPPQLIGMATSEGYRTLGIKGGKIEPGYVADLIMLDRKAPSLCPGTNLSSDVVFSANGDVVRHSIINGSLVMEDRKVKGEDRIITDARNTAIRLLEAG